MRAPETRPGLRERMGGAKVVRALAIYLVAAVAITARVPKSEQFPPKLDRENPGQVEGSMLWFIRNRLPGSHPVLSSTRR